MRKFIVGLAGAAALAFSAPSQAQLSVEPGTTVYTSLAPGEIGWSFFLGSGVNSGFSRTLVFDVKADNTLELDVDGNPDALNFTNVTLNAVLDSGNPFSQITLIPDASDEIDFGPLFVRAGLYTLLLQGTAVANSQISGTVAISSVPEPATWAMLLLGFGAIGFQVRRRRERVQVSYS